MFFKIKTLAKVAALALAPYFKEALPEAQALLQQLRQLDSPLGDEAHD